MSDFSGIIARFAAQHRRASSTVDRLSDIADFGFNPGNLRARIYVPKLCAEAPALVVVLHGCSQTAASYDTGSGWSQLADEFGFILLLPEQRQANNPNRCFNWFHPDDTTRGRGEALSIRRMIDTVVEKYSVDRNQIFITGLSAGGAMTSVMLATYPEVFAGGAINAGLPYGCAASVPQALEQMRDPRDVTSKHLGGLIRQASGHDGPWPSVSVWHGSADAVVNSMNAQAIIDQWRGVHHVAATPSTIETIDDYPRRVWRDASQREVIEHYSSTLR